MKQSNDVRDALQREAARVKSALGDFTALAGPRKKKKTDSSAQALPFDPPVAYVPPVAAKAAAPGKPISLEPSETFGGWFDDDAPSAPPTPVNDFFGSDASWKGESNPSTFSTPDFDPGSGADFSEGFEAEVNLPAKAGQDTLSVPAMAVSENTPADGMPKPPEAINDVLDGFEW